MNITVIGIGKLGLGFALLLEKIGYNVVGVDVSHEYVDMINNKQLISLEPEYETLLKNSQNFSNREFLSAICHEIKNPLNAIVNFSSILQ